LFFPPPKSHKVIGNSLNSAYDSNKEHFDDSIDLLLYTFDMSNSNISYMSEHITPHKSRVVASDELEERIAKMEYLDLQLYEWALSIFKGRVRFLRKFQPIPPRHQTYEKPPDGKPI